jgi:hypothetical protein
MLPASADQRRAGLEAITEVLSASGDISGEVGDRLAEIARLFEAKGSLARAS